MSKYGNIITPKLENELKYLNQDQAILKAVRDSDLNFDNQKPIEIYQAVLERLKKNQSILD